MKNSDSLMAAVAPLALMAAAMGSTAAAKAAETAAPRPIPKVRVPTTPPQIENMQRVRTPRPIPEEEESASEDEAVKADSAEAIPASPIRKRIGTPRIDSRVPAEVGNEPRIRTQIAVPDDEEPTRRTRTRTPVADGLGTAVEVENIPRIRTGVPAERKLPGSISTDEDEAPPRIERRRRPAEISTPAEVENTPRIRNRVPVTTEQDTDAAQAPPTRRRIGNPGLDSTIPVTIPGPRVIRSLDSAQTDCLFRPKKNPVKKAQSASSEAVNILALVCRVGGKASLMSFLYDMPADKKVADARSLASQNHDAGAISVIGYELDPAQVDASGKPLYQLLSVNRGEQSRKQANCIDAKNSFSPATSEDGEGLVVQKWCSDGSNIFPLSFKVNRWLEPAAEKTTPSISMQDPNDKRRYNNIQTVYYDDAIPADGNGSLLIRSTVKQIDDRGWDCKLVSRDSGSLYCESDPVEDKGTGYTSTQTTFLAYSLPEVRVGIGPLGQDGCENVIGSPFYDSQFKNVPYSPGVTEATRYYDYKKATCTSFRIAYRLLPGTVSKEHRSLVGGACRLAASAGVQKDVDVTQNWSRKTKLTKENNMVMEQPLGESSGVSRKISKVKAPCL